MTRPTVAVIGAGVSGLTAAHVLSASHDVTLFESDHRLGGHAHTHDVPGTDGGTLAVDSGFIVHNEQTYPHLLRLFAELDVATAPTEMSMSISCSCCGLDWAGGKGLGGILAQKRRLFDPRFVRLLIEVPRFHKAARALLDAPDSDGTGPTWGEFLEDGGYSTYFIRHFAIPLVSCVWSSGDDDSLAYPARHLFRFLDHHQMLHVKSSPTWRTVVGGSRTYVDKLAERLADVRVATEVTAVLRHDDHVEVRHGDLTERFDKVVVATHADQALALLADASASEKEDLAAIRYSINETWLHRDTSLLPATEGAKASWNYRMDCSTPADDVVVSYWMNRLQGLKDRSDHIVTLNAVGQVDPETVIAKMTYMHPVFTAEAVEAAARLRSADGERLAFAGAHLGWGFHEDGCRSGVEAAASLGAIW